jgi:hypothetical protein
MSGEQGVFGILGEYETSADLVAAAERVRESGYTKLEAYTPHPVHGVETAIGYKSKGRVQKIVFLGGLAGLIVGFGLPYWVHVLHYPFNVAGRPLATWIMFFPPAFELTILFAAFGAIFGMLALNGLPMLYHPVFNVPAFKRASADRFFLCIESDDPKFDRASTRDLLESTTAVGVHDVDY